MRQWLHSSSCTWPSSRWCAGGCSSPRRPWRPEECSVWRQSWRRDCLCCCVGSPWPESDPAPPRAQSPPGRWELCPECRGSAGRWWAGSSCGCETETEAWRHHLGQDWRLPVDRGAQSYWVTRAGYHPLTPTRRRRRSRSERSVVFMFVSHWSAVAWLKAAAPPPEILYPSPAYPVDCGWWGSNPGSENQHWAPVSPCYNIAITSLPLLTRHSTDQSTQVRLGSHQQTILL